MKGLNKNWGNQEITHFLHEIQRITCTTILQQLQNQNIKSLIVEKEFKKETNGADISVISRWIAFFIESRVAAKVLSPLYMRSFFNQNSYKITHLSGQRPVKKEKGRGDCVCLNNDFRCVLKN